MSKYIYKLACVICLVGFYGSGNAMNNETTKALKEIRTIFSSARSEEWLEIIRKDIEESERKEEILKFLCHIQLNDPLCCFKNIFNPHDKFYKNSEKEVFEKKKEQVLQNKKNSHSDMSISLRDLWFNAAENKDIKKMLLVLKALTMLNNERVFATDFYPEKKE